jgi:hypothetical protein
MLNHVEHIRAIITYNDVQQVEKQLVNICLPILVEVSSPQLQ